MKKKELLIHMLFWLLPIIYILFITDNFIIGIFSRKAGNLTIPLIYGTILNIVLFYTIALIIVPRYFKKNYYINWFFYILGVLIIITLVESIADLFYMKIANPDKHYDIIGNIFMGNFVIHIVFLGLSLAYAFSIKTIMDEKNKQKLIQEKLNTELAYLKSQINPHFLFNILNNLFSLALSNNDSETADGILKLSRMMRYMLYEGRIDKIPLSKEINYIENYIDLQKLRFHPDDDIKIHFEKSGAMDSFMISPFLLISFVENAFKHGISINHQSKIDIDIHLANNMLKFKVYNTKHYVGKNKPDSEYSGFGLKNVKNRLEMLYKGLYELEISDDEKEFNVSLIIKNK